jgi:predicted nucleic acid-binding protein
MIVLDTNVLSSLIKPAPDRPVVKWLDHQPRTSIWICSVTVLEIRYGLQILVPGRKRSALTAMFEHFVEHAIEGRIAPFDNEAAERAGELMATRHRRGRPGELRDTMIAGIVLARRATLATRNITHFEDADINVVNPWED